MQTLLASTHLSDKNIGAQSFVENSPSNKAYTNLESYP
jgi:hypothetical protein